MPYPAPMGRALARKAWFFPRPDDMAVSHSGPGRLTDDDELALDRLLVESVTDYAIFRLDPEGYVRTWNPGAKRIKGYDASEIIGRHFSTFYTREDRAANKPARALETASRTGRYEEDGWRVRKDGSRFWANVLVVALKNSRGELVGFAKITRDLTQRRQAEEATLRAEREAAARAASQEALRASEKRESTLRAIFDQVAVGIAVVELGTGRWLRVNPTLSRMLGYTEDELLERTNLDLTHPDDKEETRKENERLAAGGKPVVREKRFIRSDAEVLWAEISVAILDSTADRGKQALAVVADITAKKAAEKKSEEEARRLRERAWEEHTLRMITQRLAAIADVQDAMQQVAKGMVAVSNGMSAYVEQVVTPKGEVEVVAVSGDHTPALGQRVPYPGSLTEEIIKRRKPALLTHMEGVGKSMAPYLAPHCRECSVLVIPLLADEEVLGAVVLLEAADQPPFDKSVVDRTRILGDLAAIAIRRIMLLHENEDRRKEAEGATRSRDEMLAIVAHDLRNPLHTALMSAKWITESSPSGQELQQQLKIIVRSGERMDRLIRDLVDISQIEAGRLTVVHREEDPGEVAREACAASEVLAKERNQSLTCAVGSDLPRICVDRDRVVQALSNFIGNSIKFTPEGGKITIGVSAERDGAHFCIADTGPGIPAEQLRHVFDRFWQAKATAQLGSGLGLAIAKGIAEAHGGRVWAESEPGKGSTFHLLIPHADGCRET